MSSAGCEKACQVATSSYRGRALLMASKGEPSCEAQNSFIQVNEIRSATDEDFDYFIRLVEENDGWIKKLDKGITVWQKETSKVSPIRMAKVK